MIELENWKIIKKKQTKDLKVLRICRKKKALNELADIKNILLTDIKGTLNIMNNKLESIDKKQDKMIK